MELERNGLITYGLKVVLYYEAGAITKEVYIFRIAELLAKGITRKELMI